MQFPSSHLNWSGLQVREAAKVATNWKLWSLSCSLGEMTQSLRWARLQDLGSLLLLGAWDCYLRQFISSLPSLQSASPSQRHFLWMHSPEPHCTSLGEHFTGGTGWRPHCSRDSSDWSEQSASSSHTQLIGIQVELLHWNSWTPQVGGAQSSSSLPSLQSSWPLQTKFLEMHCPLLQVNSAGLQVTLPKRNRRPLSDSISTWPNQVKTTAISGFLMFISRLLLVFTVATWQHLFRSLYWI